MFISKEMSGYVKEFYAGDHIETWKCGSSNSESAEIPPPGVVFSVRGELPQGPWEKLDTYRVEGQDPGPHDIRYRRTRYLSRATACPDNDARPGIVAGLKYLVEGGEVPPTPFDLLSQLAEQVKAVKNRGYILPPQDVDERLERARAS